MAKKQTDLFGNPVNNKDLKGKLYTLKTDEVKILIKCKICNHEIPEMDFKDHLGECIHSVEYRYDPSSFYTFHGILDLIKKHLGDKEIIIYINGFREDALESLFGPMEFKVSPVSYSIYNITDSIINGLQSNDPEFYDETLRLLWSFFNDLSRLITGDRNDYYLASLLELFNEIYEKGLEHKLEHRVSNLNDSFERVVNKYKDKVIYCYYKLGGTPHWRKKIHFLDDTGFFSQEFYKRLKEYGLVDDIDHIESSITRKLISKIIIANFQNKEIKDIFPRVKNFFKYESDFLYDFKLKLGDFLEYVIDINEAKSIRQVPINYLDIDMGNIVDETGCKENLIFNNNKNVIYFQRNGKWGLHPEVLEIFPEPIFNLTYLQKLDLSRNKIRKIPESIDKLTKLKYFLLDKNELISLPESIGNLENLKLLYAGENKISYLPESIGKLKSLEWLSFGANKLKVLPNSMRELINLTHIDLTKNQFRKVPEVLSSIQSLVMIDLSDNYIRKIPESIVNLKSLERLYLRNTKIEEIPELLKKHKSLHVFM